MTLWRWFEAQGVPGFVLGTWIAALPIGSWVHRVTERRHKERLAAMRESVRSK